MAGSLTTTLPRRNGSTALFSTVKLARWQIRHTWRLLLVTGVGILIAVVLVCAVPLYAQIALSAGIRQALNSSPNGSDITVHSISQQISAGHIDSVTQQLNAEIRNKLGPYASHVPQISLQMQQLTILAPSPAKGGVPLIPTQIHAQMNIIGSAMQQASAHLKLLQGRLPQTTSLDLEVAITPETASALQLKVGSVLPVQAFSGNVPPQQWASRNLALHVVGIFKLTNDPFWHNEDFQLEQADQNSPPLYKSLASNDTLLYLFSQMNTDPSHVAGLTFTVSPDLFWYYSLDVSRIDLNKLDDVVNGLNTVLAETSNNPTDGTFVQQTQATGPLSTLTAYRNYISVIRIPATSLWLLLMGMVLYFVSVMTDILVDRKSEAIAILRSRGASRRQIFGLFVAQSIGLGLVALILGPLLALIAVRIIAQHTLTSVEQGALNLLMLDPMQIASGLLTSALIAVVVAIVAMIISIFRATRSDVLTVRRETARSTHRPLWQRMGLDVIAAIIALTGYAFSIYVTTPGVLSTRVRVLVLSPMTLVGVIFFLLGATLLFLRAFPLLLRLGAWLATRSRGAAPILALAQMARAPRQFVRTIMLLALATAFTIFALVFSASQSQRIVDVAGYQVGSDFSGKISGSATIAKSATYRHLPGITSATVGYMSSERAAQSGIDISVEVRAVDAATFAQTANWNEQDSSQSLASLMAQLAAQRDSATSNQVVPAIVDASAWNALHLSVGSHFSINDLNGPINCIAIAEVQHIPTITDSSEANDTGDYIPTGGILVDYQNYAAVMLKANNVLVPTTYVWLRTAHDPASVAQARNALTNGPYHLDDLNDRQAIIASLNQDPLYLALLGMLATGAITALILALVGNLIASWQSARSRLTNFAVLRALGSTRQQIASVLFWEQCIVYTTSLGLGIIFGVFLSALALPVLVFTSAGPNSQIGTGQFYVMQSVPPIQVVIPTSLWITLGILIITCIVALSMMVLIVSRPSISQTLRLNED